ncbi:MAG: zinc-binding dehydrogenase [Candidatus Brocadiia bacterium]
MVEQKHPLAIAEIRLPEKLEYGQVLVKIFYSGICGSQLNEIDGIKGPDRFLPHLLGHEGSAEVLEIGDGVTCVGPGDRVVLHWRRGAGIQAPVARYSQGDKQINAGWVTTFNEYAVISENRMTKIPPDFDMRLAPLFGCAIPTAYGVIHNDAKLKSGESLVIFGAGGVGAALCTIGALASAYPIIAVDINSYKLEQAKKHGATHTIDSAREDTEKAILELLPGGADVVVDTTGVKPVRELSFKLTNATGVNVLVGVPRKGEEMSINSFQLHFDKRITGSHGGDAQPDRDIPRLIRLQQAGKYSLEQMITKEYSLERINEAIADMRAGQLIRCVVKM